MDFELIDRATPIALRSVPCAALLGAALTAQLSGEVVDWLWAQVQAVAAGAPDRQLFASFSVMPRRVGKADLVLNADQITAAQTLCPGWQPQTWSVDQAARSLLLLALPQADAAQVQRRFEQFFTTAGLQELIALLQTLPLLPHPDRYRYWADEGIRSHMKGVFEAIVLHNPYPSLHFDEAAWNQMVLKAVFIESSLAPIYGFDDRANPTLARMAIDYIRERWAAGRRVTPEIWRAIGPFVTPAMLPELERGLAMDDPVQRAAILNCYPPLRSVG
ncbi:MAG: hypothetical protein RLZZ511_330 [Cyanobacteriota bacterium]|jgi:hypothetical protein